MEIEETLPLILEAVKEGRMTEKELYERVERDKNKVAKGLRLLYERGNVTRAGSGKRGDPYTYETNAPFLPSLSLGGNKGASEMPSNLLRLRPKFSLSGIDRNSLKDGSSKVESLTEKVLEIFPGSRVVGKVSEHGEPHEHPGRSFGRNHKADHKRSRAGGVGQGLD